MKLSRERVIPDSADGLTFGQPSAPISVSKSSSYAGSSSRVLTDAALAELEAWLADTRTSGVRAVGTFAAGLEQDGAAARSALTTPWSNGQAEGQVTRLKLLKRQMYGRVGFDLLRRRTLLAA